MPFLSVRALFDGAISVHDHGLVSTSLLLDIIIIGCSCGTSYRLSGLLSVEEHGYGSSSVARGTQ